jgi:hypothetical protein
VENVNLEPLEDLVERHREVIGKLYNQIITGKGRQFFEETICLLLGRSQKYAKDAFHLLLERRSWESAA